MQALDMIRSKWQSLNFTLIDVKEAMMEWAEGFVGY